MIGALLITPPVPRTVFALAFAKRGGLLYRYTRVLSPSPGRYVAVIIARHEEAAEKLHDWVRALGYRVLAGEKARGVVWCEAVKGPPGNPNNDAIISGCATE